MFRKICRKFGACSASERICLETLGAAACWKRFSSGGDIFGFRLLLLPPKRRFFRQSTKKKCESTPKTQDDPEFGGESIGETPSSQKILYLPKFWILAFWGSASSGFNVGFLNKGLRSMREKDVFSGKPPKKNEGTPKKHRVVQNLTANRSATLSVHKKFCSSRNS